MNARRAPRQRGGGGVGYVSVLAVHGRLAPAGGERHRRAVERPAGIGAGEPQGGGPVGKLNKLEAPR